MAAGLEAPYSPEHRILNTGCIDPTYMNPSDLVCSDFLIQFMKERGSLFEVSPKPNPGLQRTQ